MAVNDKISASDYNSIRNAVNTVYGTGSGQYGYGQTLQSPAIVEGNSISINEWTALQYDIINTGVHQTGTIPSLISVAEGDTVRYDPTGTTAPITQYRPLIDTYNSNRFSLGDGQYLTNTKASTSMIWPGPDGDHWQTYIYTTMTVKWSTADAARYFFNSGGQIRIASSRIPSGGRASIAQNQSWTDFLTTVGIQTFGATSPAINFYNLTNSFQQYYSANASGAYSRNYFKLSAKCNTVTNNSNGTENTLVFLIEWHDDYVRTGGWQTLDFIQGTFTVDASTREATGILYPVGTGNFTVESPTITIADITQSF